VPQGRPEQGRPRVRLRTPPQVQSAKSYGLRITRWRSSERVNFPERRCLWLVVECPNCQGESLTAFPVFARNKTGYGVDPGQQDHPPQLQGTDLIHYNPLYTKQLICGKLWPHRQRKRPLFPHCLYREQGEQTSSTFK